MYCLSSAGLQNLLSICDKYCASHSITFNVKKSVCMFFKRSVNKHCDYEKKCILNPIRSGGGGLKAPPPIFCSHAFNFGATLLCVGDFSQTIV